MAADDKIDAFLAFGQPIRKGHKIIGETGDVIEHREELGLEPSMQIKGYQMSFEADTAHTEETHSQSGETVAPNFKALKVTINKIVDSASPFLLSALRYGYRYERVLISQRKAGGVKGKSGDYFWLIELKNVLISDLTWNTDESGTQNETLVLTYYDEITPEYFRQLRSGELEKSPVSPGGLPLEKDMKDSKSKNGKDDDGKMSPSQAQSIVDQVVQRLKNRNPNLHIKA